MQSSIGFDFPDCEKRAVRICRTGQLYVNFDMCLHRWHELRQRRAATRVIWSNRSYRAGAISETSQCALFLVQEPNLWRESTLLGDLLTSLEFPPAANVLSCPKPNNDCN